MPEKLIRPVEHKAMQEKSNGQLIFSDRVGDITYDEPDGSPVLDAIAGVDNRNDNARNPEEGTDDAEDMTNDAPYPLA